jgi:hypothetical protein
MIQPIVKSKSLSDKKIVQKQPKSFKPKRSAATRRKLFKFEKYSPSMNDKKLQTNDKKTKQKYSIRKVKKSSTIENMSKKKVFGK